MATEIISKRCSTCKNIKQLSEFSKDRSRKDGLQNDCKTCDRFYRQSEKGKTIHRRADKKYRNTPKGRAIHRAAKKRFKTKNPNHIKAKDAVNNAIKTGKLPRPDSLQCHYCPKQAKQYHHHKGYAKEHWLDVIPVCVKCHSKINLSVPAS